MIMGFLQKVAQSIRDMFFRGVLNVRLTMMYIGMPALIVYGLIAIWILFRIFSNSFIIDFH